MRNANGAADDSRDTIGTPDLLAGTATFDDSTGLVNGISGSDNTRYWAGYGVRERRAAREGIGSGARTVGRADLRYRSGRRDARTASAAPDTSKR